MIQLLLSVCFATPLSIQTDLHENYLHKQSIVIQFNIRNSSNEAVTVPDLSEQTWRTSFSLTHPDGHTDKRSNSPKSKSPEWTLKPREQRQIRLEVPSSAGLGVGSYTLKIQIDYEKGTYEEQRKIDIRPLKAISADILTSHDSRFETLWLQQGNGQNHVYSDQRPFDVYLGSTTSQKIQRILQKDIQPHYYWLEDSNLFIQTERQQRISLGWPNAKPAGRLTKDASHYYLPIWVPRTQKGDLYVAQIDAKGIPVFRKVHVASPEILGSDSLISTTHEIFYLVYTKGGVEFFKTTANEQPNFPVNSKYVLKADTDQEIKHALFQLHPEHGVSVFITFSVKEKLMYQWFSIHGRPLGDPQAIAMPPFVEIVDASAVPLSWIIRTEKQVLFCTADSQKVLPPSLEYAIGKDGPLLFSKGNLIRHKP
ncbi:MAG: hypothetical protein VX278_19590 [Myxococcota bacterium]|nr:hypothetical protein [Myxococcota bacterium]